MCMASRFWDTAWHYQFRYSACLACRFMVQGLGFRVQLVWHYQFRYSACLACRFLPPYICMCISYVYMYSMCYTFMFILLLYAYAYLAVLLYTYAYVLHIYISICICICVTHLYFYIHMHMCHTFIFRYTYAYLASESRYAPQAGGAQISLDLKPLFHSTYTFRVQVYNASRWKQVEHKFHLNKFR